MPRHLWLEASGPQGIIMVHLATRYGVGDMDLPGGRGWLKHAVSFWAGGGQDRCLLLFQGFSPTCCTHAGLQQLRCCYYL